MQTLMIFIRFEVWIFLGGLILVMASQMMTGRINISKMLYDKGTGNYSPVRVQLLVSTFMSALYYLFQVAHTPGQQLPDVPVAMLSLLGGSHALYLGGKAFPLLSLLRNGSGS